MDLHIRGRATGRLLVDMHMHMRTMCMRTACILSRPPARLHACKHMHVPSTGRLKRPPQVACFLAAPEEVDPDLKGESRAVLVAQLKADGVPDETIQNAVVNVLPFLPGQESKWGESLERPKKR